MPRVPVISTQPGQTAAYQATGVVPFQDASGPQAVRMGEAMLDAGSAASRIADQLQNRIDTANTKAKLNLFADQARATVIGYSQKLGQDAVNSHAEAVKALERQRKAIENTLENDDQREAFSLIADDYYRNTVGSLDAHRYKQAAVWEDGEGVARAESMTSLAVESFVNPGVPAVTDQDPGVAQDPTPPRQSFQDYRNGMLGEVQRLAERRGMGPEATKALLTKADDALHGRVVNRLITEGRTQDAIDYLERAPVSGEARADLEKSTHKASVADQSLRGARELEAKYKTVAERLDVLDQAFDDKAIDAEVYDATRARVLGNEQTKRQVEADDKQRLFDVLRSTYSKPGNERLGWDSVVGQPLLMRQLEERNLVDDVRNWFENGKVHNLTQEGFNDAREIPDAELRAMSASQVWDRFRFKLNDREFNQVTARHEELRGVKQQKNATILSEKQILERTAREIGILPEQGKASDAQVAEFERWQFEFDRQLQTWQQLNNKAATLADMQEIADLMMQDKVQVPGTVWGYNETTLSRVRAVSGEDWAMDTAVTAGQGERVELWRIPESEIAEITRALADAGVKPTMRNIANEWIRDGRRGEVKTKPKPKRVMPQPTTEPRTERTSGLRSSPYPGMFPR